MASFIVLKKKVLKSKSAFIGNVNKEIGRILEIYWSETWINFCYKVTSFGIRFNNNNNLLNRFLQKWKKTIQTYSFSANYTGRHSSKFAVIYFKSRLNVMAVKSLKSYSTLFYIVLPNPWEYVFLYVLVMHTALTTLQLSLAEIESVKNTVNQIIQFLLIHQAESLSPNEQFSFFIPSP